MYIGLRRRRKVPLKISITQETHKKATEIWHEVGFSRSTQIDLLFMLPKDEIINKLKERIKIYGMP